MNLIESIQSALYERVVSPLAGVFLGVWCVTHYEAIFILFSDFKVVDKLQFMHEYFVLDAGNRWEFSIWSLYFEDSWAPYFYGLIKPLATSIAAMAVFSFFSIPAYFISTYGKFLLKIIRRRFDEVTPIKASSHAMIVEKYKEEMERLNEKNSKNEKALDSYRELYRESLQEVEDLKSKVILNTGTDQFLDSDSFPEKLTESFKSAVLSESSGLSMSDMFFDSTGAPLRRKIMEFTYEALESPDLSADGDVDAGYILDRFKVVPSFPNVKFIVNVMDGLVRKSLLDRSRDKFLLSSKGLELHKLLNSDESAAHLFCMNEGKRADEIIQNTKSALFPE